MPTSDELYLAGLRLEQFYSPAREPDPYYEEAIKRERIKKIDVTRIGHDDI